MATPYMLCPKCRNYTLAYDTQNREYVCQLNDSCAYLISEKALKSVCSNDFISDSDEAVLNKLAGMDQHKRTIGIDLAKGKDETVIAYHCRGKRGGIIYEQLVKIAKINPDRIVIIESPEPNEQIAKYRRALEDDELAIRQTVVNLHHLLARHGTPDDKKLFGELGYGKEDTPISELCGVALKCLAEAGNENAKSGKPDYYTHKALRK